MFKFVKKINFQKIKSFDTITTKLLVLVLFTTIIPLFVIVHFSINMITSKEANFLASMSIISFFVAIIFAILFSRRITTPILTLVKAANNLAEGNLDYRLKIKGNDEIAQLAVTFNKMAKNLKQQQQLRDNFTAALTHDLKVPMLAENQTITYLLKETYGTLTQDQREVLELIKSTNNLSLEMVSTLLDVYKYDMGIISPMKSQFNLVSLLEESVNEIKSLADEKKVKVSINSDKPEIFINADKRELKRVFHNLINNAISNGVYQGNIECIIKVHGVKTTFENYISGYDCSTLKHNSTLDNSVLISVKDDGTGIAREDMEHLFKRFALSNGRKPAGTGIGLFYSKQVIELHNGFIWAESTEGKGSMFSCVIPLS